MLRKLKAIENWTLLWCYAACRNYHYYLRNNPEERTFHNLRDGSLKSRYREPYKTLEYILSKMTTRQNALAEYCSYNISHPRTYLCTFQPWVSRSAAIISRSLRTVVRGKIWAPVALPVEFKLVLCTHVGLTVRTQGIEDFVPGQSCCSALVSCHVRAAEINKF